MVSEDVKGGGGGEAKAKPTPKLQSPLISQEKATAPECSPTETGRARRLQWASGSV